MYKAMQGMTNIHMLTMQRQAFSRAEPSRLLSGAIRYLGTIRLPSAWYLIGKPPSGATSSGKDLGPMLF